MAMLVSETLAKEIVRQLSISDFVKHEPNRSNPYNLAELTGLSPNTIALYEAGVFPTKANSRLLKSFIASGR